MLTPEGIDATLSLLAGRLGEGRIEVSNGTDRASAPVLGAQVDGGTLIVNAVFGDSEGNFEWRRRTVIMADGTVLDDAEGDFGRKAAGAVWAVDAEIELVPARAAD